MGGVVPRLDLAASQATRRAARGQGRDRAAHRRRVRDRAGRALVESSGRPRRAGQRRDRPRERSARAGPAERAHDRRRWPYLLGEIYLGATISPPPLPSDSASSSTSRAAQRSAGEKSAEVAEAVQNSVDELATRSICRSTTSRTSATARSRRPTLRGAFLPGLDESLEDLRARTCLWDPLDI